MAPIVLGKDQMASYDYWAVGEDPNHLESEPSRGMNCCPGQSPDFRCGESGHKSTSLMNVLLKICERSSKIFIVGSSSKRLEAMKNDENR